MCGVGWEGGEGVVGICFGYGGYIICRAFLCTIRVSLYYIFWGGFSSSANGIGLRPIGKFVQSAMPNKYLVFILPEKKGAQPTKWIWL